MAEMIEDLPAKARKDTMSTQGHPGRRLCVLAAETNPSDNVRHFPGGVYQHLPGSQAAENEVFGEARRETDEPVPLGRSKTQSTDN